MGEYPKYYEISNYQSGQGAHHPIVSTTSYIIETSGQTATFPVLLAKGGLKDVPCTKQDDGSYTGKYKEPGGYSEDVTFIGFPGGLVNADRKDPLAMSLTDNDTGTFTATEIPPPNPTPPE